MDGLWPKTVQDFPSGCDRAARSCAVREHLADRTTAMQNPSASNAGLRDSAARPGIKVDRTKAMHDSAASATRAPTLHTDQGSGWQDHGNAGFLRTERDRATGWDSARAQLAPDPQGVGSLLGRAGEARSGFCREVKRRHAGFTINGDCRRLTSRQNPDCLRGPAEERAHPRHPTIPNPSPPHQRQHPRNPGTLSEEGPAGSDFRLETAGHPVTQRVGGWSDKQGDAKRPPHPDNHPDPTRRTTTPPPAPSRSSTRSRAIKRPAPAAAGAGRGLLSVVDG